MSDLNIFMIILLIFENDKDNWIKNQDFNFEIFLENLENVRFVNGPQNTSLHYNSKAFWEAAVYE